VARDHDRPAAGSWDLSAFETLTLQVRNTGEHPARVGLRADGPDVDGKQQYIQAVEEIAAGQEKLVRLPLQRRMPAAVRDKLFGMRGYPGQLNPDSGIDVARVIRVQCFVSQPDRNHTLEISDLQASGQYDGAIWLTAGPDRLFPMIDRFGQYMHSTWPGKTVDEDDLRRRIEAEDGELASHPGPAARNQYGGWTTGRSSRRPDDSASTKRDGKWWLVDPEGRLFWSHGADCVRSTTSPRRRSPTASTFCLAARQGLAAERVLRQGELGAARLLPGPRRVPDAQLHRRESAAEVRRRLGEAICQPGPSPAAKLGT
jgi:hypothetical protein